MKKLLQTLLAVVLVLSLAILARGHAADAANPGASSDQAPQEQSQLTVSLDDDDDKKKCKKNDNKKNQKKKKKDKCKDDDDDDDDDEGEDDDDDDGTVRPPDDDNEVCDRKTNSVGGAATVEAKNLKKDDCYKARAENPATLSVIPNGGGTYQSDAVVLELPASGGKIKICFAAPPGKKVKIHAASGGTWTPIKTSVKKGLACAEVKDAGAYTLIGQ